jgi:integrase
MATLSRHRSGRKAGRYYVDYTYLAPNGRRRRARVSLETTDEAVAQARFAEWLAANAAEDRAEVERAKAGQAPRIKRDPEIRELCLWYTDELQAARGNAPSTRDDNRRFHKHFCDWLERQGVIRYSELLSRPYAIDSYVKHLMQSLKPNTVRMRMQRIRAVFRNAHLRGMIERLPLAEWPMPKESGPKLDETITSEEFDAVLAAIPEQHHLKNAITLMAYVGCRPSDVAALEWRHVDLKERTVSFLQKKTGGYVSIPLSDPAYAALVAERAKFRSGPRVFRDRRGEPAESHHISKTLLYYSNKILGKNITPKAFRQFVVTDLAEAGLDGSEIRLVTGHLSSAAEAYQKRRKSRARAAAEAFAARRGARSSSK